MSGVGSERRQDVANLISSAMRIKSRGFSRIVDNGHGLLAVLGEQSVIRHSSLDNRGAIFFLFLKIVAL